MSLDKNKSVKKSLFVGDKVVSIDTEKMEITFKLEYAHYLKECQVNAKHLLNKLSEQCNNTFSEVPIRALDLTWNDHSDEMQPKTSEEA